MPLSLLQTERLKIALNKIDFLKHNSNEFLNNLLIQQACLKCLKIVGEALTYYPNHPDNSFSQEIIQKYPQVPFKNISELRHSLTHNYYWLLLDSERILLLKEIFNIITTDIPVLAQQLTLILKIEGDNENFSSKSDTLLTNFETNYLKERNPFFTDKLTKKLELSLGDFLMLGQIYIKLAQTVIASAGNDLLKENALSLNVENLLKCIKEFYEKEKHENKQLKLGLGLRAAINKSNNKELMIFFANALKTRADMTHLKETESYNLLLEKVATFDILSLTFQNFLLERNLKPSLNWLSSIPTFDSAANSDIPGSSNLTTDDNFEFEIKKQSALSEDILCPPIFDNIEINKLGFFKETESVKNNENKEIQNREDNSVKIDKKRKKTEQQENQLQASNKKK